MDKLKDLKDLLVHEVQDLVSAEDQIIEAMPAMIEKANNATLTNALKDHLKITEVQRKRLDEVQRMLGEGSEDSPEDSGNKGGFLSSLFGGGGGQKCKGMEGLITEGNKVMAQDMNPEVLDAAIIACAQKIEHYEICGYGTAKAYARELQLPEVEKLLDLTLNEEYDADDNLTSLAVGRLNQEAESPGSSGGGRGRSGSSKSSSGGSNALAKKSSGGSSSKSSSGGGSKSAGGSKSSGGSKSGGGSNSGSNKASGGGSSKSSGGSKSGGGSKSSGNTKSGGGSNSGSSKSSGGGSSKSSGGSKSGGGSKSSSGGGSKGSSASKSGSNNSSAAKGSSSKGGGSKTSGGSGNSGGKGGSKSGSKGSSGGTKAGALRRR